MTAPPKPANAQIKEQIVKVNLAMRELRDERKILLGEIARLESGSRESLIAGMTGGRR